MSGLTSGALPDLLEGQEQPSPDISAAEYSAEVCRGFAEAVCDPLAEAALAAAMNLASET